MKTLKAKKKRNIKTRKCILSRYNIQQPLYDHIFEIDNDIRRFCELQISLAKKEKTEYLRPMVHLHIYNDTHQKPIYLLGGMGPLSDIHFLKHLKNMLGQSTKYNIRLFSLPPPRSIFHWRKIYSYSKMIQYIQTFIYQEQSRNTCMFLLSNSAHLYRGYLSKLNINTFDMTPHITKYIQSCNPNNNPTYLILSTNEKLYKDNLNKMHIDSKQTEIILNCVRKLKENRYNYKNNILLKTILAILKPRTNTHIILACTELSIWYMHNKNKIPKEYVVHDTSFIMSYLIVQHIKKIKRMVC